PGEPADDPAGEPVHERPGRQHRHQRAAGDQEQDAAEPARPQVQPLVQRRQARRPQPHDEPAPHEEAEDTDPGASRVDFVHGQSIIGFTMAENGATTSGQLRTHNRVRLLRAVHDGAAAKTRAQLTRELGLARGTASVLVSGLTEDFLLHEEPTAEHARGRPTMVPGPHPRGPVALAADVREDAWELVACELGGRVTVLETRPHDGTPQDALATLGTALHTHATRYAGRIIGIGVAVAGPVRPDG